MSYSDDEVAAKMARLCTRTHSLLSVLQLCPRAFVQQVALVTGNVKRAKFNAKTLEEATGSLGLFSRESWFLFIGTVPLKCALCRGVGSS